MLVLTRKINESLEFDGPAKITLMRITGNSVRIAVEAPNSTHVVRTEIKNKPRRIPLDHTREDGWSIQADEEGTVSGSFISDDPEGQLTLEDCIIYCPDCQKKANETGKIIGGCDQCQHIKTPPQTTFENDHYQQFPIVDNTGRGDGQRKL